jgi:hypothetical protein
MKVKLLIIAAVACALWLFWFIAKHSYFVMRLDDVLGLIGLAVLVIIVGVLAISGAFNAHV